MNIRVLVLPFALAAALGTMVAPAGAQQTPAAPSLYKQLGGYDAIAAVSADFIKRLASNPKLSRFFVGLNDEHKALVQQRVVEFICFKTGGPCIYTGRDMKTAHAGLRITEDDWNAAIADFKATEAQFNIPPDLRAQLEAFLTQLKPDIVTG
ncbi:MAG TPA: group 1 truncated hemoglobin [Candidatus Cybelea sp.]|nr:group 1 truncated hemoglobin [Candidatus Cybelea sp.]